jgi:hypothetical protein
LNQIISKIPLFNNRSITKNKADFLATVISTLFPLNSEFDYEHDRTVYFHQVYNCIPDNLNYKLKYQNISDKELVIFKIVLDFCTGYLKEFDTPYFKKYRKDLIKI